jgi:hypothetical protein
LDKYRKVFESSGIFLCEDFLYIKKPCGLECPQGGEK